MGNWLWGEDEVEEEQRIVRNCTNGVELFRETYYVPYLVDCIRRVRKTLIEEGYPLNVLVVGAQGNGKTCARETLLFCTKLNPSPTSENPVDQVEGERTDIALGVSEIEYNGRVAMKLIEMPGTLFRDRELFRPVVRKALLGMKEGTLLVDPQNGRYLNEQQINELNRNNVDSPKNIIDGVLIVTRLDRNQQQCSREVRLIHDIFKGEIDALVGDGRINGCPIFVLGSRNDENRNNVVLSREILGLRIRSFLIKNYCFQDLIRNRQQNNHARLVKNVFEVEYNPNVIEREDAFREVIATNPRSVVSFFNQTTHNLARLIVSSLFRGERFNSSIVRDQRVRERLEREERRGRRGGGRNNNNEEDGNNQ